MKSLFSAFMNRFAYLCFMPVFEPVVCEMVTITSKRLVFEAFLVGSKKTRRSAGFLSKIPGDIKKGK